MAVTGAMAVALPPTSPASSVGRVADVRLTADPVPVGGLITSFLGNQVIYCSIICPDVVKLVITVPAGAVAAPVAFVEALPSGNVFKAIGGAAASVTNPLDAAFDPIITNDLNLVLPRAQNALEVGVVGLLNIASSTPSGLADAVQKARQTTFDALNDTIPPSLTSPNPLGLVQVVAVEAIEVASSVAFQAFEEGLLGVVQTVDVAATTLADTGNPVAAATAGAQAAQASATKSLTYIVNAVDDAVTNISAALHDPASMTVQEVKPANEGAKGAAKQTALRAPRGFHMSRTLARQAGSGPVMRPRAEFGQAVGHAVTTAGEHQISKEPKTLKQPKAPKEPKTLKQSRAPKQPKESQSSRADTGHDRLSRRAGQR